MAVATAHCNYTKTCRYVARRVHTVVIEIQQRYVFVDCTGYRQSEI